MLNMISNKSITPSSSIVGFSGDESPIGDKRAHMQLEKFLADKLNSPSPSDGFSGVLTNAGLTKLPHGASDLSFGMSGTIFGVPLYTLAVGHELGVRLQNVWNEGAVLTEKEEKEFERVFERVLVETLSRLARSGSGA